MKPVVQTRYGYPDGNCFAASVASILELPLDECDWWDRWQSWLRERGLTMYHWPVEDKLVPPGWAILNTVPPHLIGTGPAGVDYEVGHAVVAYDGRPVHNPNPTFTDLGRWSEWIAFGVLDASRALCREVAA